MFFLNPFPNRPPSGQSDLIQLLGRSVALAPDWYKMTPTLHWRFVLRLNNVLTPRRGENKMDSFSTGIMLFAAKVKNKIMFLCGIHFWLFSSIMTNSISPLHIHPMLDWLAKGKEGLVGVLCRRLLIKMTSHPPQWICVPSAREKWGRGEYV